MRPPPAIQPPAIGPRPHPGAALGATVDESRHYHLITPLFGGGVEAATADPITRIRGSSVRGHLRFWWRACRGGEFNGDLQAMHEAENLLWGAASSVAKPRPSKVRISIVVDPGHMGRPFVAQDANGHEISVAHFRSPYSYAAFPLQDRPGSVVLEDIEFALRIQATGLNAEEQRGLQAALWAWETFGGIGARTRRGFGALQRIAADGRLLGPPTVAALGGRLRTNVDEYVSGGRWPMVVPHLTRQTPIKITPARQDVLAAWSGLLDGLRAFRQRRTKPRGRSLWPEADEIRHLTGQSLPAHRIRITTVAKFPRAVLGLPIVFHFIGMDRYTPNNPNADPRQTILQGRQHDRLASPILLRPLLCADGTAVGIVTVLLPIVRLPGGLILKDENALLTPVQEILTAAEQTALGPLNGRPSVIQALLDSIGGTSI